MTFKKFALYFVACLAITLTILSYWQIPQANWQLGKAFAAAKAKERNELLRLRSENERLKKEAAEKKDGQ
jgi:hypothetical protein